MKRLITKKSDKDLKGAVEATSNLMRPHIVATVPMAVIVANAYLMGIEIAALVTQENLKDSGVCLACTMMDYPCPDCQKKAFNAD